MESVSRTPIRKQRKTLIMRNYEKYYAGYELYAVPKANGKGNRICRVYRGDYHVSGLTPSQDALLKVGYFLLFFLSISFFILSANKAYDSGASLTGSALCIAGVGGFLYLLFMLIEYCMSGVRRTHDEYRACGKLKRAALIAAGISLVPGIWQAAELLLGGAIQSGLLCAAWNILSAGLAAMIAIIENKKNYHLENSEEKIPENGIRIEA